MSYNLDATLDRLGWSQAMLARRVDVHPNTVTIWCRRGPPTAVKLYLELLLRLTAETARPD